MRTFDDVRIFRDLRATCPLPAILRAHKNLIAGIHPAEAKGFANRVRKQKSHFLLAPLLF